MSRDSRPHDAAAVIDSKGLDSLIQALEHRGYQVLGPVLRDSAIDWGAIRAAADLPVGWTSTQAPGAYRIEQRLDTRRFAYAVGPSTLKRYLHEPERCVFTVEANGNPFRVIEPPDRPPRRAFIGVRPCDLASLAILDRVLIHDRFPDAAYRARRENIFIVTVNCTEPSGVCFCDSTSSGPHSGAGFDLALTELDDCILVESGSPAGTAVLQEVERSPATKEIRERARTALAAARKRTGRKLDLAGVRRALFDNFEHPEWEKVAARCLGCGNCTQVCPTCFCITFEDTSDIDGSRAERRRRWDSCFTLSHSYIHGGSVRQSAKARHRQWVTHKLAAWEDQFGTPGCVGCGRCITWCPVGIDITETAAAVASQAAPAEART